MLTIRQRLSLLVALWALSVVSASAATRPLLKAPTNSRIASMLFVGNSFFYYNNGILRFVSGFSGGSADGRKLSGTMITISGSGLDWHAMESYFRPHAVGYYNFDKRNNLVFSNSKKPFDAVLMMDCSQCPFHPQLGAVFSDYARRDAEIARRHDVEPMLFMSWAYKDHPEMTSELDEAYTKAGNANNELVVPAGLAFARVREQRPDIELYQPDLRHPTVAGSYLAGAVIYASITGKSLDDDTFTAGLDSVLAAYLRKTAWTTAAAYYAR